MTLGTGNRMPCDKPRKSGPKCCSRGLNRAALRARSIGHDDILSQGRSNRLQQRRHGRNRGGQYNEIRAINRLCRAFADAIDETQFMRPVRMIAGRIADNLAGQRSMARSPCNRTADQANPENCHSPEQSLPPLAGRRGRHLTPPAALVTATAFSSAARKA